MSRRPAFDLSPWDNRDTTARARRMTAAQAEQSGAMRFRLYHRSLLIQAFNRRDSWPFVWDVGTRLQHGGKWWEVAAIRPEHSRRLVRVSLRPTP